MYIVSDREDFKAFLGLDYSQFIKGFQAATKAAATQSSKLADTINLAIKKPMKEASKQTEDLTDKMTSGYKSVGRVVQGILISQVFYRTIQAFKDAASAVFQVAEAAEVAHVSFATLLNDTPKAERFLAVLEDFAAVTPFTIQDSRLAAQRLMAMGIQAENTLPILRAVLDASTMTGGDSDTIERISEALGKINTMGRVTQRQMLQLAYAGIPAYAILEEKLGLTKDQLKNLGKLRIPADIAIKALVQGIEDRYRNITQYVSHTVPGLISTLKDDLLLLGKYLISGPYERFRGVLHSITDELEKLRTAYRKGGLGAVFNAVIPKDMQASVRTFLGNLAITAKLIGEALGQMRAFISELLRMAVIIGNAALPILNAFMAVLLFLQSIIVRNTHVLRLFVSVITTLLILKTVTMFVLTFKKALLGLMAVQVVIKVLYELARAVVVVTLALMSNPWTAFLVVLGGSLMMLALNSGAARDALADLGSQINRIFGTGNDKIMPMTADKDIIADQEEFNKGLEISKESMDDMGESSEKAKKAAKDVFASFDEVFTLADKASSGADNAEGIVDEDLLSALNMKDLQLPAVQMPDIKPPNLSGIFKNFWKDLWKDIWDSWLDEYHGSVAKTKQSIKNFKEWCKDLKIKIEIKLGEIGDWLSERKEKIQTWYNETSKTFNAWYSEHAQNFKTWCINTGIDISLWCLERANNFIEWYNTTSPKIKAWVDEHKKSLSTWCSDTGSNLSTWYSTHKTGFATWCSDTGLSLSTWFSTHKTGFFTWCTDTGSKLTNWISTHKTNFVNWCSETGLKLSTWYTTHKSGLLTWATDTENKIDTWSKNTKSNFTTWVSDTGKDISSWCSTHKADLISWCNETYPKLSTWWTNTKNGFGDWARELYNKVFGWLDRLGDKLEEIADKVNIFDDLDFGDIKITTLTSTARRIIGGHASGGVFSREHYARFAEGNKPEMIVPTGSGNDTAKVVSMMLENGLQAALDKIASSGSPQPVYVGTLIADDRSLRELERRMKVIRIKESARTIGG